MNRPLLQVFAAMLGCTLGLAAGTAGAQTKTLRFVAHADVKILDPTFTTAYITRNFGYMVYDTLFAQDAKGVPKPQMVDKYTTSKDGRQWSFTLRPGLKFSDGKRRHVGRLHRLAAALERARQHRPRHDRRRRRVEGRRRPHLHVDAEGTLRPGARRPGQAVRLPAGDHAGAPRQGADDRAADRGGRIRPLPLQARRMGAGQQGGVPAEPGLRRPQGTAERPVGQQDGEVRSRRVALPPGFEQLDRGAEERRSGHARAGPARLHHAAAQPTRTSRSAAAARTRASSSSTRRSPPFNNAEGCARPCCTRSTRRSTSRAWAIRSTCA